MRPRRTRSGRAWLGLRLAAGVFLGSACLTIACGGDTTAAEGAETGDEPTLERICDGSPDLRLAWFLSFGGGIVRTEFQYEVGFYYLYVRGDCRYWVVPYREGGSMWIETHTGVIDEAQETELIELLQYGDWDDLLGVWPEPGSFDAAILRVHDGHSESGIGCVGECPDAPQAVQDIRNAHQLQLRHWWELGEPSTGPMRVLAVAIAEGENTSPPVPWTVDLDLAPLAVTYEQSFCRGMSQRVADPATIAALREFRAQHADALEEFTDFYVEVEPGVIYELYLRDALPFEDEYGLIPQYNGTTPDCF